MASDAKAKAAGSSRRRRVLFVGGGVAIALALAFVASAFHPGARLGAIDSPDAQAAAPVGEHLTNPDANPPLPRKAQPGQTITIGVFGDSFAEGIWYSLLHGLPANGAYKVLNFTHPSTGFSRPDIVNVQSQAESAIAGRRIDIAVVDFGANDTQGTIEQGRVYPYLTPGWRTAYAGRMTRYVQLLRGHGAVVYWVGLPMMRAPAYDRRVTDLMGFYTQTLSKLGVPFLPVRSLTQDKTGAFALYIDDPATHRRMQLRTDDGVHFSMHGYGHITRPVIDRILADLGRTAMTPTTHARRNG